MGSYDGGGRVGECELSIQCGAPVAARACRRSWSSESCSEVRDESSADRGSLSECMRLEASGLSDWLARFTLALATLSALA